MGYNDNPPYFLTAYDIAVRWGFKGTEEEWLNSLTAFAMAQEAGYTGTVEDWLADLIDPIPDFQIGEVETLDGGSMATATITGDKRKPLLNLGIPRGLGMTDAMPLVGGTMKGSINMDSNELIGLPEPTQNSGAVPKSYADRMLPRDGSKAMENELNMANHEVIGLPTPTKENSAAPKSYVDKMLPKSGGTMSGDIDMGTKKVTNVGDPAEDGDAVNKKFVEDRNTREVTVTLLASGWSASAPYTQTVVVEGLTDKLRAKVYPNWPEDAEAEIALKEETAKVSSCRRSGSNMTFRCLEEKPELDIPVTVEVYV